MLLCYTSPTKSKLNWLVFLLSHCWEKRFRNGLTTTVPHLVSDHCPLLLDSEIHNSGPAPFKFENVCVSRHEFGENTAKLWAECSPAGWAGYSFMKQLQFVEQLKVCNKGMFGLTKMKKIWTLLGIEALDKKEKEVALSVNGNMKRDQ